MSKNDRVYEYVEFSWCPHSFEERPTYCVNEQCPGCVEEIITCHNVKESEIKWLIKKLFFDQALIYHLPDPDNIVDGPLDQGIQMERSFYFRIERGPIIEVPIVLNWSVDIEVDWNKREEW